MHVLIVEDDPLLVRGMRDALGRWSHSCTCVGDATGAMAAARGGRYDAILLDLGLATGDGLDVLARLRREGDRTPVLITTARDGLHDRIAGLDAGADDYLVKPFHLDELAARLRAIHRRARGLARPLVEAGPLVLDANAGEATLHGSRLQLSRAEFALLCALAERAGRMVPRAALERALYGDGGVGSNALEVHVHSVRRKLPAGAIRTIRGFGYMLVREEGG
jgi:two-component system response regulator QseB